MRIVNPHLDRVISDENYRELLEALTAKQLVVVALMLDGANQTHVGEILGVDRRNVWQRLNYASNGVRDRLPDISPEDNRYRGRGLPSAARGRTRQQRGRGTTSGVDKE